MKKAIFSGLFMVACAFSASAQSQPSCVNDNGLEARINSIEAQGWKEISRDFSYVYYFAEPTPPYLIGSLQVVFGRDCADGEPCPEIALLYREDATQINQNVCRWSPDNN